jgi:hypothetical protein
VVAAFLIFLVRIRDELLDGDRRAISDLPDFPFEDPLSQDTLLAVAVVPPLPRIWMVARAPYVGLSTRDNNEYAPHIALQ